MGVYKPHITKILNDTFASYRKDKELLQLWLATYVQTFADFIVPPFVPPFLGRTTFRTRCGMINMGRIKEGIETIMEVDSIATKMATKSTQVAPNTTKAVIKIVHPSTLSTIIEIKEGTKNLQLGDGTRVVPMVEYIVFW